MRKFVSILILVPQILLLTSCASDPPPVIPPVSVESVQQTVYYLSSDELEGRGIGTQGLETAATYIAGYFRGLGLQPPPDQENYFQTFKHTTITGLAEATTLRIGQTAYKAEADFVPLPMSAEKPFSGGVAFVGYGISASDKNYDDYAGADVKGRVALALRFEPTDSDGKSRLRPASKDPSPHTRPATQSTRPSTQPSDDPEPHSPGPQQWSEHATLLRKAMLAEQHGASALLIVHPPLRHSDETLDPVSRSPMPGVGIPVLLIKQKLAQELLQLADAQDLKTFQEQIDSKFSPRSFLLKRASVEGSVALARKTHELKNVMAYLPGKGPRAKEVIVIGAHYDHLGRGGFGSRSPRSNEIHNGADDNASGTAAILELARMFSQTGPLPRSLLLVAFSGEESGLLGSEYFVAHPPIPLKRVVAMINLDMVGRLKDKQLIIGGSGTAAPLSRIVEEADAESDLSVSTGRWKDGLAPTDSTSFVTKRIPALFFFTGTHEDYHRPTDDPGKVNYPGLNEIIRIVANVVVDISREKRLKFTPPPESASRPADPALRPGGASLGVVPDYSEGSDGLRITGTTPGSAAEKAGMKEGDLIVQIEDKKITDIYALTEYLNSATPGKPVKITVMRNGKSVELTATLTERRTAR